MKKQRKTINNFLSLATVVLLLLVSTTQINASKFGVSISETTVETGDSITLTASIADEYGMIQVAPKASKNIEIMSEVSPSGTLISTDGKDLVVTFKVNGPGEISVSGFALDVDFKEYTVNENFVIKTKVPATEIEDSATTTIPSTEIEDNATVTPSSKSDYETALEALRKADASRNSKDIALAQDLADKMDDGWQKNRLLNRLAVINEQEDANVTHDQALLALRKADASRNADEIEIARKLINKLDDGWQKTRLVNRLTVIDAQEANRLR